MSSKGFRILGIGLVVLLAGAGLFLSFNGASQTVEAQDQATTTVQLPRTITVVGEGTVAVEPDAEEPKAEPEAPGEVEVTAEAETAAETEVEAEMASEVDAAEPDADEPDQRAGHADDEDGAEEKGE